MSPNSYWLHFHHFPSYARGTKVVLQSPNRWMYNKDMALNGIHVIAAQVLINGG
jgi:hypothetical protein